jgi:hypothetical protein
MSKGKKFFPGGSDKSGHLLMSSHHIDKVLKPVQMWDIAPKMGQQSFMDAH